MLTEKYFAANQCEQVILLDRSSQVLDTFLKHGQASGCATWDTAFLKDLTFVKGYESDCLAEFVPAVPCWLRKGPWLWQCKCCTRSVVSSFNIWWMKTIVYHVTIAHDTSYSQQMSSSSKKQLREKAS